MRFINETYGLLHLLGYNDIRRKNARIMHHVEREVLAKFGYTVAGL